MVNGKAITVRCALKNNIYLLCIAKRVQSTQIFPYTRNYKSTTSRYLRFKHSNCPKWKIDWNWRQRWIIVAKRVIRRRNYRISVDLWNKKKWTFKCNDVVCSFDTYSSRNHQHKLESSFSDLYCIFSLILSQNAICKLTTFQMGRT